MSIIIPRIAYGLVFYKPPARFIQKFTTQLIKPLAHALHLYCHPHQLSLLFEYNIPSISLLRDIEIQRFKHRIQNQLFPHHPSTILFTHLSLDTTYSLTDAIPSFDSECYRIKLGWLSSFHYNNTKLFNSDVRAEIIRQWLSDDNGLVLKNIYPNPNITAPLTIPAYIRQHDQRVSLIHIIARLRFSRSNLRAHQSKYDSSSKFCVHCSSTLHRQYIDDQHHLLLHCQQFHAPRQQLQNSLLTLGYTPLTLSIMLAAVEHIVPDTQQQILHHLFIFYRHIQRQRFI
jgi:hypothetical protein